jgi:hypothetical protein
MKWAVSCGEPRGWSRLSRPNVPTVWTSDDNCPATCSCRVALRDLHISQFRLNGANELPVSEAQDFLLEAESVVDRLTRASMPIARTSGRIGVWGLPQTRAVERWKKPRFGRLADYEPTLSLSWIIEVTGESISIRVATAERVWTSHDPNVGALGGQTVFWHTLKTKLPAARPMIASRENLTG